MQKNNKYYRNFDNYNERSKSITIRKFNWDLLPGYVNMDLKDQNKTNLNLIRAENMNNKTRNYYQYLNNLIDSKFKLKENFNMLTNTKESDILG